MVGLLFLSASCKPFLLTKRWKETEIKFSSEVMINEPSLDEQSELLDVSIRSSEGHSFRVTPNVILVANGDITSSLLKDLGFVKEKPNMVCNDSALIQTSSGPCDIPKGPCLEESGYFEVSGHPHEIRLRGTDEDLYLAVRRTDRQHVSKDAMAIIFRSVTGKELQNPTSVPISVQYQRETSLYFRGGRTLVSVQGDAARRAHFLQVRDIPLVLNILTVVFLRDWL